MVRVSVVMLGLKFTCISVKLFAYFIDILVVLFNTISLVFLCYFYVYHFCQNAIIGFIRSSRWGFDGIARFGIH